MSSSSSVHHHSDQMLQHLTRLRSLCVKYQCDLIESIVMNNRHYQKPDILVITDALMHEKTMAGNLAGKLEIELLAGQWTIAKTDFLDDDKFFISQKLLGKLNFSENDIREILQDLLIAKFDSMLEDAGNDEFTKSV